MLYERWQKIAADCGGARALRDLATGREWTFSELARAVEDMPRTPETVVHPQGQGADFILTVLQGWRSASLVCPLEPGQAPPAVRQPPQGCVHLKLTSATTGTPRVVAFTATQLMADAENILVTMGLRPEWPNLAAISLAHSYGFSNLVLPLLLHGIPLILATSALPEAVRSAAESEKQLTLPAVPALWRAWHEARAIPRNVRLAISAGAPLPSELEGSVFESAGLKIHNFYGSTECGGIAYDCTTKPRTDEACVGTPLRNVAVALDAEGCVQVRSGAVGETYWPDACNTLRQGVFQSRDLAELLNGVVHLRGRLGDRINIAGRKVVPETIEQALRSHPALRECVVFGVPSEQPDRTEQIVACVNASASVSGDTLRDFLLDRLPAWQVPREWWFVEELSANRRGKLSRTEWRERFLSRRRQAGTMDTTTSSD